MKIFDIASYFEALDKTKEPLEKILLKREFNRFVHSLSETQKAELKKQETAYFQGRIAHYRQTIDVAKQQMQQLGIEV